MIPEQTIAAGQKGKMMSDYTNGKRDYTNGKLIIEYAGHEYTFRLHIPIEEDMRIMANKAVLPVREIYLPMTEDSRWERKDDEID